MHVLLIFLFYETQCISLRGQPACFLLSFLYYTWKDIDVKVTAILEFQLESAEDPAITYLGFKILVLNYTADRLNRQMHSGTCQVSDSYWKYWETCRASTSGLMLSGCCVFFCYMSLPVCTQSLQPWSLLLRLTKHNRGSGVGWVSCLRVRVKQNNGLKLQTACYSTDCLISCADR